MTKFWHANCMTSIRSHRTPLLYSVDQIEINCGSVWTKKNMLTHYHYHARFIIIKKEG